MVLIARILLFVLIVAIAAVVGAFAAFFGLYFIGRLMGATDFEGALAMGAAGFMPAGAVVGAVAGAILAWVLIRKLEPRAAMGAGYAFPITIEMAKTWAAGLEQKGILLAPVSALTATKPPETMRDGSVRTGSIDPAPVNPRG